MSSAPTHTSRAIARDNNPARTGKAREKTKEKEQIDIRCKNAAEGCADKYQHADKKRSAAAEQITQRPHEDLSECHAERRHGQRHLNE